MPGSGVLRFYRARPEPRRPLAPVDRRAGAGSCRGANATGTADRPRCDKDARTIVAACSGSPSLFSA